MLTILGWLWQSSTCAAQYRPEHANIWARMIHRNLAMPHRFVLMTDTPSVQFDPLIEPVRLWDDWKELKNPKWSAIKPTCYIRLKAFSDEARQILGERFVSIDLDCIVRDFLDPLFDRTDDFLMYHRFAQVDRDKQNTYQGSMWMMKTGARRQVWDDFHGAESVRLAADFMGTDQAWIRYKLGPGERGWSHRDGVYSWPQLMTDPRYEHQPPADARIIFFNGNVKPWQFPTSEPPTCDHCGHEVRALKAPWQIVRQRGFGMPSHAWVGRYYR